MHTRLIDLSRTAARVSTASSEGSDLDSGLTPAIVLCALLGAAIIVACVVTVL